MAPNHVLPVSTTVEREFNLQLVVWLAELDSFAKEWARSVTRARLNRTLRIRSASLDAAVTFRKSITIALRQVCVCMWVGVWCVCGWMDGCMNRVREGVREWGIDRWMGIWMVTCMYVRMYVYICDLRVLYSATNTIVNPQSVFLNQSLYIHT